MSRDGADATYSELPSSVRPLSAVESPPSVWLVWVWVLMWKLLGDPLWLREPSPSSLVVDKAEDNAGTAGIEETAGMEPAERAGGDGGAGGDVGADLG